MQCIPPSVMAGKRNGRKSKSNRPSGRSVSYRRIGINTGPVPSLYPAKLLYFQQNTLTAAGSTNVEYGYRANSLFDPDFTGAGLQPMYYDQLSAMYSKYRVISAKFEFDVSNETEETTTVAIVPTMANSVGSSILQSVTQRYSRTMTLGAKTGGSALKKCVINVPIGLVWGVKQSVVRAADDFAALTSGSPNNVVYVWLVGRCIGTTAPIIRYTVKVTYNCEFHMPFYVGTS